MITSMKDRSKAEIKMFAEFISAQFTDKDCRSSLAFFGKRSTCFNIQSNGALFKIPFLDGALKWAPSVSLRTRLLYYCNYSLLAGDRDKCEMDNDVRKELYWPHVAKDVYSTVWDCCFCTTNFKHRKRQRKVKLFIPKGPMEYVCMDILRPLPRTKKGNQFRIMMTDRYKKLTKRILPSNANDLTVACSFLVD